MADLLGDKKNWGLTKERFSRWWGPERLGPLVQLEAPVPGKRNARKLPAWADSGSYARIVQWAELLDKGGAADQEELLDVMETDLEYRSSVGDGFPQIWLNIGPGALAAFMTGRAHFMKYTTWFGLDKPMDWDGIMRVKVDGGSRWWVVMKSLARGLARRGKGRYIAATTDLGGIADVLASLRTNEQLLEDVIEEPEKVLESCRHITRIWHECYEELHSIIASEGQEGTGAWMGLWSPKRWYPIQCDFSAMISPKMFEKLVIPFIEEQCDKLDHVIYHWDGPGEIPHLDLLLAVKKLHGIQWVPGAGNPQPEDEKWFPLYERIQRAGKRLVLNCPGIGSKDMSEDKFLNVFRKVDKTGLLVSAWARSREEGVRIAGAIGVPAE